MIKFGTQISKKECKIIFDLLEEYTDEYRDFYITQSNLRLFIKENPHLLFKALKKGDKIVYGEEGIVFVTGWSDNSKRKYLKVLSKDNNSADKLLKILLWKINTDLYIKIKKNNPLSEILKKNGFYFKGDRGKEILMVKKYIGER